VSNKIDWIAARAKWESNPKLTHEALALEIGVSKQAVGKRVNKEGWSRQQVVTKTTKKVVKGVKDNHSKTTKTTDITSTDAEPSNTDSSDGNKKEAVIKDSRGGKREGAGKPIGAATILKLTIKERAAALGEDAITVMAEIMNDAEVQPQVRLAACDKLLDRGFGKPKQEMEVSGELKYVDKADLEARYAKNMEKTMEYARIAIERQESINAIKPH